jgi:outer membrane protein assembly factor BamB
LEGTVSTPRGVQMTTTLTDRHVLAILGQTEGFNYGGGEPQTVVVCLDRATGRLLWKSSLNRVTTEDEALRTAKPAGSVLVAGDSVYVVARNRRPGAFEDSYLCCFALEDGSLRWARHLASGNATRAYIDYNLPQQITGDSHLAYADGSIYISTDMGGIASVNAADGTLSWLSVYPRPLPQMAQVQWAGMNAGTLPRITPAYVGNPVIVEDGLVITLPGDAENVFVHDAVTGQLRGSVSMLRPPDEATAGAQSERFQVLVGLSRNRVVVAGSRSIALLDLASIEGVKQFKDVEVRSRDFLKPNYSDDTLRGRPFLTSSSIYVPTAWKLYRMSIDADRALEMYPPAAQDTWDLRPDEKPGNVIFANDSLVVAGPDRINIYSDLSLLRKRMESAVAADSRSIAPRLRYADALFNAGQTDESLRWIDSSIEQLTANGFVSPGPDRDRVFDQLTAMFRRLSVQERTEVTLRSLLERLSRTADTPMQQVTLELAQAYFAKRANEFASAVQAYQRIIEGTSMGSIRLRTTDGTTTASDFAVAQIEQIVKANGSSAYERVEARAKAALASAQAANDASKLLAVLSNFPNSQAGREAVNLATKVPAAGGVDSIRILRRLGAMPTELSQKMPLYRSLLQAELERGDVHSALGRARMIARLDQSVSLSGIPSLDGRLPSTSTPTELVKHLQQLAYEEEDLALPDLKVPETEPLLELEKPVDVKDIRTILVPSNPRNDRVVALGQDKRSVLLFEPGNAKPTARIETPEIDEVAPSTWHGDALAVVASTQVVLLDTKAARVKWSFDPQSLKPAAASEAVMMALDESGLITPTAPPKRQAIVLNPTVRRQALIINAVGNRQQVIQNIEEVNTGGWDADEVPKWQRETIAYARLAGDACVVVTSRGRVIGLDIKDGSVRWQSTFSDRPPSMVGVYDNLLIFGGNNESGSNLVVYRAEDGSQVINQSYSGPIQRRLNAFAVSREGYLATVHSDFINLFDLGSGDASPVATFDGEAQSAFAATRSQPQVQFCADKLLVLVNDGRSQQVRMFDALTLEPAKITDNKTRQQVPRQIMPIFQDGMRQGELARMYVQKDRLLLRAGRDFMVYRVPVPDATPWARPRDPSSVKAAMSSQSPLFVRDGIVVFDWPEKQQVGQAIASPRVQYFKRDALGDGREIGTLLGEFNVSRPNSKMLDRVQPVNGGVYTVWTDGTLTFYPARNEK